MAIETPYSKLTALIIDDMAAQQTTLRGQLSMLGISKVECATSAEDAVRALRRKPVNLVLCDYNLNQKTDGQQLFEYLREQDLLPPDALFFMVTAENGYASVASATEQKPDAYLLKPITATDIEERLKTQLDKRKAFRAVNEAVARQDTAAAVAACDALLAQRDRWQMSALQTKGQLLLQLGRHEDARAVYLEALAQRPQLVWAQLGLARANKAAGNYEEAKQIAYDIIQSKDGEKNVAAYDVVAESLEAQGDPVAAQWVLRDAATAVPSARRLRLEAESAFRNGDLEVARERLQRVAKSTRGSIVAQPQDALQLAQTLIDLGHTDQGLAVLEEGRASHRHAPQFESVALAIRAQGEVKAGRVAAAQETVARARETLRHSKADFATVALAKAELMTGHEEDGLKRLGGAVAADHENARVKQWVQNALKSTGHQDKLAQVVEAATGRLNARVGDAKALFRNSRIDEALVAIEAALKEFPENTGVLLQAAQMNCLALRLKKVPNPVVAERVRLYLNRLEKLMPGSDRVTMMQRYYRETLAGLAAPAPAAVPVRA